MERLTNKRESDAQREEYERRLANGYPRNIPEERFLRLAAYEDTGLTPGDIKELLDMAVSKTDKVLRLKEELQGAKNTADQYAAINEALFDSNMKLGADRKDLINELCQYCGKYKQAHEGTCDGCRWMEM